MGNSVRLRALALVTTGLLGLGSLGGVALAAAAPTGDPADQGRHLGQGQDPGPGHAVGDQSGQDRSDQAKGDRGNHGRPGDPGHQGKHAGQSHAPGQQGERGGSGAAGDDPLGNNGTVKIAELGELDGIPNNTAHPGCTFQVEWYGFDGGSDVVSTVTFAMQAPTSDAMVTVDGPSQVPVGEDAATGAGTDTGLDAAQAYTLSFDGAPHSKQGYHVRLTVATPRSRGNDTKSKLFWVAPCAPATSGSVAGAGAGLEGRAPGVASGTAANGGRGVGAVQGVLGETYAADSAAGSVAAAAADETAVPTAVEAGEDSLLPTWAQNPLPLTLVSLVLVLAGAGIVLRNRSRV
ncbi:MULTISPECIES: hypothetical protein [unclassified Nocardioides]|uniref:hypothetical protein n=1 Tax=unclassified Nocardioides TaxID=2615069 RepID=UPI000056FED4|nr:MULTISPECIES: hypothetical protein [unclassified Nocardioides]ABL82098.1 hypothetical protein Noca_2594 [Nocardioides sp. JS614]